MAPTRQVDVLTLTAVELQRLLTENEITSEETVELYLAQIAKHNKAGLQLNAVITVADRSKLLARARQLDRERQQGKIRGPLHGVPYIIKDSFTTVDMPTTCGSFALMAAKAKADANIINTLADAGLILLAKANLSEWGYAKGVGLQCGWSAVGGQTQSPYVKGGVTPDATFYTTSGPGGSSSGSAVAVAAGFAPLSIGTELDGSIIGPASRAGVYAIKLTPDSVDHAGTQPGAPGCDSQGPFAKTVSDVATLSAIMQLHDPGHYHPLPSTWDGLKVGVVDPALWRLPSFVTEHVDDFFQQTDAATEAARETIQALGGRAVKGLPLPTWEEIALALPDPQFGDIDDLWPYAMKANFSRYLSLFEGAPQTLEEVIKFNLDHADIEFNAQNDNQKGLEAVRDTTITQEQYERNFAALREFARASVHKVLAAHDVDVILAPGDSMLAAVGAAGGFPIGNLPLGFARFNGRAFSLFALAPAGCEAAILRVMAAWEATFSEGVRPSPLLLET
ncbi:amidase signature domain-containing protein [Lasiosphaeria miniovina]|uniref:Amidase signature domain-containing protein n=1 Tax=Lasiosphaeria miniovina TaxID=1954250 RepID=A0AA40E4Y5_9PEZI|nr:amidase signature domain-containing protein [Lasiosphaeria miniovina]KAK0722658.1 amidase signature domain-containing protein [Lasiosphaeria miniovina]